MTLTVGIDASVVNSSAGGTRVYALQLLRALVRLRPRWTFVLYLRRQDDEAALGEIAASPNVRTRVVGSRPNAWRIQVDLATHLHADGVDIYHSLGYFLPLRWRGPKIITVHDLNIYVTARNWLRPPTFLPWLDLVVQTGFSIHLADRVITDSESSRRQITTVMRLPAERVDVIPLAADPFFDERATAAEVAEVKVMVDDRPFVLFVGILSPQKNLLMLLRAFAASGLEERGTRLVLAGSDVEDYASTLLRSAGELGIRDSLVLTGFVARPVLRALYQTSLSVVLPSHGEGFGLPLVEAMAAGSPILAANRQAIPEVLGESGCLFEPNDVGSLAALLKRLAADERFLADLKLRSSSGRGRFSWEKTAAATAAVYEEVVASRRR